MSLYSLSPDLALRYLFLHGAIVLWAGLLSGFGFWLAIIRGTKKGQVRAWRVAHATLVLAALLMIVFGVALPHLSLSHALAGIMAWALILSGYGFVVALTVGAFLGIRGLTPGPAGVNTVLFAAHLLGASGALVGAAVFLYGALMGL